MPEGMEKSGSTVESLAEEWKELLTLHVNGEYPDDLFKKNASRLHSKIYDFINDPKTQKAGEELLEKVYGDVGKDFFDEEGQE